MRGLALRCRRYNPCRRLRRSALPAPPRCEHRVTEHKRWLRCTANATCSGPAFLPQAQHLYPHIAARDAEDGVNEVWLRTLNEANYRFRWAAGCATLSGWREESAG